MLWKWLQNYKMGRFNISYDWRKSKSYLWKMEIVGRAEFMKYKTGIFAITTTMLCTMGMAVFTCNAVGKELNGGTHINTMANDAYPVFVEGITTWNSENSSPSDYYGVRAEIVQDNNAIEITGTESAYKDTVCLGKFATALRSGVLGSPYLTYGFTDILGGKENIQESIYNFPNHSEGHSHSGMEAQKNEDDQIDLESAVKNNEMIPAIGVGGVEGFIYPADYIHNDIKTPEQALEKQRQRNGRSEYINLYAEDGKTVIGKMEVTHGGIITK